MYDSLIELWYLFSWSKMSQDRNVEVIFIIKKIQTQM